MRNKIHLHKDTISEIFVLLFGGLITLGLFLLNSFAILDTDFEVVFAPLVVTVLLTWADKLLIYLLLGPLSLLEKLISRAKDFQRSK